MTETNKKQLKTDEIRYFSWHMNTIEDKKIAFVIIYI